MPSTVHILETALLILAAFLIGCVIGYVARRLTAKREVTVEAKNAPAETTAAGPQLVVAPVIAPVSRGPSPAQRLAAAASGSAARASPDAAERAPNSREKAAAVDEMQPARRAGQATSGKLVPPPLEARAPDGTVEVQTEAPTPEGQSTQVAIEKSSPPAAMAEPIAQPERAEDVPPIDDEAHVVGRTEGVAPSDSQPVAFEAPETFPEPPLESAAEPSDSLPEPVVAVTAKRRPRDDEDAEAAAMRAIEGSWTPRAAVAPKQPAPEPDLAPSEIEAAMRSARSAVASATAAAEIAVARTSEPELPEPTIDDAPPLMTFEPAQHESVPSSFLEAAPASPSPGGLGFEPERPLGGFGRPEGLPAPRNGGKDNLRQIRAITPEIEAALNRLGIFHFDQLAAWDQKNVVWLDHHLALHGRIGREKWIDQARRLVDSHHPHPRSVRR